MKELSMDKLLEYLKHAIDAETDAATQERIIERHESIAQDKIPVLTTKPFPDPPAADEEPGIMSGVAVIFVGIGLFFGLNTILQLNLAVNLSWDEYSGGFFALLATSLGSFFIAAYIFYYRYKKREEVRNGNANRIKAYQARKEAIRAENKELESSHRSKMQDWQTDRDESRATLSAPLDETRALLGKLYSADVIYPKYRTLPALTSIYEYLITGRCDSLTGPHGAYNLYEDEVRKDMVITQLSQVVANLESIKSTQYQLYQQVSQMNQTTSAIAMELQQIKGCAVAMTELAALNLYYTQRNERHNRIASYCDMLEIL